MQSTETQESTEQALLEDRQHALADPNYKLLATYLAGELKRTGPTMATMISICRKSQGAQGIDIETWDRENDPHRFEAKNIDITVRDILHVCSEYADNTPLRSSEKSHRFLITVTQYYNRATSRAFSIAGEVDLERLGGGDGSAPYEASERGMTAQAIQHTENVQRMFMGYAQATHMQNAKEKQELREEIKNLRAELREERKLRETAESSQEERQFKMLIDSKTSERKDRMQGRLLQLLPVLVNRIAGKTVLPGAPDPMMNLVSSFVTSLTKEQTMQLMRALSMEQQLMIAELFKAAAQAAEAHKAAENASQVKDDPAQIAASSSANGANGASHA